MSADFSNFGADDFPFKSLFKKCFNAFARSSVVFFNSMSADLIVVAASRFLGATAACVILLFIANGCIMSARVICQWIFPILALMIFL